MASDEIKKVSDFPELELRDDDRTDYAYDTDDGRSNFVAFLLGGVVIAGGLLTFLYYDTNNLQGMDLPSGTGATYQSGAVTTIPSIATPKGATATGR